MKPIFVVLFVFVCSCAAPSREVIGTGESIDEVAFRGVTRFSEGQLLRHLYAGEVGWMPDARDQPYDEALVQADRERIEALYRAHGYFEARVVSVASRQGEDGRELTFTVEEGQPTTVVSRVFEWGASVGDEVRGEVERSASVKEGEAFSVPAYNETLGALRFSLLNRGYPLAEVSGRARVDRASRQATVVFSISPGEQARIVGLRFEGLVDVPLDEVMREADFVIGGWYSPARVRQLESSLQALKVFRWVSTVVPTEVEDGGVTLTVRVSEADPQIVKLGGEVEIDSVRWQQQVRAGYSHSNFLGDLTRLDVDTILGWAELPNPFSPDLHGPVVSIKPQLTKKGWLERHLLWTFSPRFRVDLDEGYQYYSVSERLGLSRWWDGKYRLGLSHSLDYVNFFNFSEGFDAGSSLLGRDFRDPYLLSFAEFQAASYWVNSITAPTDGVILEFGQGIAAEAMMSDFEYHRTTLQARGYSRLFPWLQLASRLKAGLISPFGESGSAPFDKRFSLGGANTVRGFGSRRLSPRLDECNADGVCESIPVGGYTMLQANVELRMRLIQPVWLVAFADAGDVQEKALTVDVDEWNFTAGPGVRVDTPLGLVRLDAGFRLNDPGVFPDEPAWGIYFGLGETL